MCDRIRIELEQLGADLLFPHQSHVQRAAGLRELRPQAGRSPWRAFYRRVGDALVVAAITREANVDRRGFNRAVQVAEARLEAYSQKRQGPE